MRKIVPSDAVLIPSRAKKVFTGEIFDVYQWEQMLFDGKSTATFEMLKRADTVISICIVDGQLLVLEEEQPHSGVKLSFPGGRVDLDDETALDAAKRETHEETGYSFKNWRLISVRQLHTKFEWFIHIYLAWDIESKDEPHIDAGEKIDVTLMPYEEVKKLSFRGVKYLNEGREIFEEFGSLEKLHGAKEFKGQEVDC